MSLRKRKGASGEQVGSTVKEEDDLNDQTQDLMKDHLELMKEVVMRIREDEEFARNIYADCPRLQNLLDRNPDLRPIFEDPNLVRINFEQVYRDAGGVLPEDEKTRAKCLTAMVNSPCFKVLKALFMIKKIMGCIAGGGIGMVTGCFMGMCCCGEDALPDDFDAEDDGDGDGGNPENERNKEALNQAADYMEDPEVQEQMDRLMEDPEGLEEAIENDEELRALRDSNPLCGELMSDPETMKILTEPDNLRALGEAPDLIEADFQDPNWSAPDVEMGEGADFDVDDIEGDDDFEADADDDAEGDDGPEDGDDDDDDDDDIWEDAELEQQEGGNRAAEGGNGAEGGNRGGEGGNRGGGNAPRNQQQRSQQRGAEGGEGGGIGASIAVAARDLAAGALVGQLLGGSADLFFGGGDDVDGLEDAADDAAEGAGNSFDRVMETTEMFDELGDNDFADTLEGGMDGGAAAMGADTGRAVQGAVAGGAAGAAIGGGAGAMADRNAAAKKEGEEAATAEGEEEEKKKGGWFGNMTSTVFTAAKEQMAATLLGDDLAEMLVEKIEDKDEDKDEDDKDSDEEDDEEEEEEKSKSKRSLFAKSRS